MQGLARRATASHFGIGIAKLAWSAFWPAGLLIQLCFFFCFVFLVTHIQLN
jgi:hypothetical protein